MSPPFLQIVYSKSQIWANFVVVFGGNGPDVWVQLLFDALDLGHCIFVPSGNGVFVPLWDYTFLPLRNDPCVPFLLCTERDGLRSSDKTYGIWLSPVNVGGNSRVRQRGL